MYEFGYFRQGSGIQGGGGGTTTPSGPPKVLSSTIANLQPNGLEVHWDSQMKEISNAQDAFSVIVNGAAPVHPKNVIFHASDKSIIGFLMVKPFKATDVVTWAYNDQHPTITLETVDGREADNQTYGVTNNLSATVTADSTNVLADNTTNTIDKE